MPIISFLKRNLCCYTMPVSRKIRCSRTATTIDLTWMPWTKRSAYMSFESDALSLPESLCCHQRTRADRIEGLCVVLKRLAYPCRLSDMIHRFGRAVPEIRMITTRFEKWIYSHHHTKITEWNDRPPQ